MRFCRAALVALLFLTATGAYAAEPAALAQARAMYNAGQYDAAIRSAQEVRGLAPYADAAALVAARAYLERHRLNADPADLAAAREMLRTVRASALSPRDQVDLLIGFGQTLYLEEAFGAAAGLFDTALSRASILSAAERARLVDWWASSLAREAQMRAPERRAAVYERIATRMGEELRIDPGSAVANYWLTVAARGEGDLDRAWDAAVAAWVRATLSPESAETLRADLDRFVGQVLIPERARLRPAREQADATAALRAEWERVKGEWR